MRRGSATQSPVDALIFDSSPVLGFVALAYATLSIITTLLVFRSTYFDPSRKLTLAAITWLVPILGAVVTLVFHSVVHTNMTTRPKPYRASDNNEDTVGDIVDID